MGADASAAAVAAAAAAAGGSACVGWPLPWGPSAAAAVRQGECAVGRSAQEEGGSASEGGGRERK